MQSNSCILFPLSVILAVFIFSSSIAQVPKTINYQGKLTDPAGVALEGLTGIKFTIYDAATGPTALWSDSMVVDISNGLFDVVLGPVPLNFDEPYWIELKVESEILAPRQPLAAVPYSIFANHTINSDTAQALDWFDLYNVPGGFSDGVDDEGTAADFRHNDLADIQGGSASQRYHLTFSQLNDLTDGGNCDIHLHDNRYYTQDTLGSTVSALASGAGLIGAFDEFENSDAGNVQGVLNDLDAAITGSATGDISAVYADAGLTGGSLTGNAHIDIGDGWGIFVYDDSIAADVTDLDPRYVNEGQAAGGDLSGAYPNPDVDYSDSTGAVTWGDIAGRPAGLDDGDDVDDADNVVGNEVTDAANATLTRSGAGTLGDPYTLALNLSNDNTWTGIQNFNTATGNLPFTVDATDNGIVTNLNTDLLDNQHGSYYEDADNLDYDGGVVIAASNVETAIDNLDNRVNSIEGGNVSSITGGAGIDPDAASTGDVIITSDLTELTLTGMTATSPTAMEVDYGITSNTAVEGDQTATITADAGLTGGTAADELGDGFTASISVGAGTGINVNPNDVAFDVAWGDARYYTQTAADAAFIDDGGGEIDNANDFDFAVNTWIDNLDADLLDGQEGIYYLDWDNFTNIPVGFDDDVDDVDDADHSIGNEVTNATNATLTRSGAGTSGDPYTLALNLNNSNTWTGIQNFNTSSGSLPFTVDATDNGIVTNLNADLLDGQHGSYYEDADNLDYDGGIVIAATTVETAIDNLDNRINSIEGGNVSSITGGAGIDPDAASTGDVIITSDLTELTLTGMTATSPTAMEVDYGITSNTAVEGDQTATITADAGLTGGIASDTLGDGFTASLSVGAGTGITVNPNDVAFDVAWGDARYYTQTAADAAFIDDGGGEIDNANDFGFAVNTWIDNLDADLLDGQEGIYYLDWDNFTNIPVGFDDDVDDVDDPDHIIGNEVTNATNATLTRSGAGTSGDPYTLAINLNNSNTWTGTQNFNTATGDLPFTVDATDNGIVTNLNTDLLDNQHGSYYLAWVNLTGVPAGFADNTDNEGVANCSDCDAVFVNEGQTNAITSAMIVDGTVTANDLQDGAALAEILDDDGTGSGLDADLLDSQESTYYLNWNNFFNIPAGFADNTDNEGVANCSDCDAVFVNEGQANAITSAMIVNGTVTASDLQDGAALAEILDDDGSTSGLDADLLDGLHWSDIQSWVNTNDDVGVASCTDCDGRFVNEGQANCITSTMITNGTIIAGDLQDGAALAEILDDDGTLSGLDADLLDGLHWSDIQSWVNSNDDVGVASCTDCDGRFVNEGQANSITSAMIVNGTIIAGDLQDGAALAEILDDDGSTSGLDADLLDGLHWSDIQSWVNSNDDNTTYSAGNDLDLSGTTFNIESILDYISRINWNGSGYIYDGNGNRIYYSIPSGRVELGGTGVTDILVLGGTSSTNNASLSTFYTDLSLNNNDITNVNKLYCQEVDPIVRIDNKNYSTWCWEGIGLRTDVVGEGQLNNGIYKIDLAKQPEASDLWLFYNVVAENTIIPFVTPQDKANLMAKMDGSILTVELINGKEDARFSFRLSAKRIDKNLPPEELNVGNQNIKQYLDIEKYDRTGGLR